MSWGGESVFVVYAMRSYPPPTPIRPAEDRYGNKGRRCSGGARGLLSRGRPARLARAKVGFSGRTHARARVTPYTGGPACTRALTDTWVPRSSAPSRHRCHRSRRARSSIRYCSSSPSFPARQKTAGHRAYWPHFSPDHSQQLTCTRARRPRSRPDPFRRTHTRFQPLHRRPHFGVPLAVVADLSLSYAYLYRARAITSSTRPTDDISVVNYDTRTYMCVIIIILRNTFADRGCCCRRRWFFPLHLTATSAAACVCVKRFACVSSSYLWCIAIVYYNRYHCAGALCNSIILYYIVALECRQVVGVDLLLHFYMHYVLYIDNLFSFAIIIPLVLTTIMFYFYSSRPS